MGVWVLAMASGCGILWICRLHEKHLFHSLLGGGECSRENNMHYFFIMIKFDRQLIGDNRQGTPMQYMVNKVACMQTWYNEFS
jgi:hypothetical protein